MSQSQMQQELTLELAPLPWDIKPTVANAKRSYLINGVVSMRFHSVAVVDAQRCYLAISAIVSRYHDITVIDAAGSNRITCADAMRYHSVSEAGAATFYLTTGAFAM